MASQWFYTRGGQRLGPVVSDTLRQMAAAGQLSPNDLVWKEGMSQWVEARVVEGLFAAPAAGGPAARPHGPPPMPAASTQAAAPTGPATGDSPYDFLSGPASSPASSASTPAGEKKAGSSWLKIGGSVLVGLFVLLSIVARINKVVQRAESRNRANQTTKAEKSDGIDWSDFSASDFVDHTSRYRDQDIKWEMEFKPANSEIKLRQCKGTRQPFHLYDTDEDVHADIAIDIPTDIDLPNAGYGDDLEVHFECNDGSLDHGNVAVSIRRPTK